MTHMTQTQSPFQDQSDVTLYKESERTSIMAILSMIFGIGGCCLGLTSIPAIFLGVFSLIGISKSKGRVGGTGFGIAGILIGLLTIALWGGFLGVVSYGLNKSFVPMSENAAQGLLDIQSDQFDSARAQFVSPGADLSDEELVLFREAYRSTLGDFVSKPNGLGEWMDGYASSIHLMESYSGRKDLVPLPMRFDSGWALVLYVVEQNPQQMPRPAALVIVDQQGNEYRMTSEGTLAIPAPDEDIPLPDQAPVPDEVPVPDQGP